MRKKFNSFRLTLDEKDQIPVLVPLIISSIFAGALIAMFVNN